MSAYQLPNMQILNSQYHQSKILDSDQKSQNYILCTFKTWLD